jgi:hypothetical protein
METPAADATVSRQHSFLKKIADRNKLTGLPEKMFASG